MIAMFTASLMATDYSNYFVTQNQFTTLVNNYSSSVTNITNRFDNAEKVGTQAMAGATALSAIDFGTTCKGKTEVGLGAGSADAFGSREYAAAIGVKHGITDNTALIAKGTKGKDVDAVAVAVTYRF